MTDRSEAERVRDEIATALMKDKLARIRTEHRIETERSRNGGPMGDCGDE